MTQEQYDDMGEYLAELSMVKNLDYAAWKNTVRHECPYCGRDYKDEPLQPGEPCSDDCPTYLLES